MVRRYALLALVAFVAGTVATPSRAAPAPEEKPDDAKQPAAGHKIAVFNMDTVLRDFHQAKYQMWLLNKKRTEMSKQLVAWRAEYIEHQKDIRCHLEPPRRDDDRVQRMLTLIRLIEEEDRKLNKQLNNNESAVLADLHDMIKVTVDQIAKQDGFKLVLALPDTTMPEESNSPKSRELKLKPPTAQPFFVAPDIDITARVIKALNEKYPPIDAKTKKPVDVSTLTVP